MRKVPKEGPRTGPRVIEQAILPLLAEKSKEMRLEEKKAVGEEERGYLCVGGP